MDLFEYIDRTEPESPTSVTPTSTVAPLPDPGPDSSGPDSSSRSVTRLKEIGLCVYKDVWTEFYDWESGYCAEILGTVTQSFIGTKREVAHVAKAMVARLVDGDALAEASRWKGKGRLMAYGATDADSSDTVTMSVTRFASGAGRPSGGQVNPTTTTAVLELPVFTFEAYQPHPEYESCTPASKSICMDTCYEYTLRFIPYADDDKFPARDYQAKFDCLEWETPFDPDEEMIQIETIKRLNFVHEIHMDDIKRMCIFKELRYSNNTGLLWEASQRDTLYWPGAFKSHDSDDTQEKHLPTYTPNPEDLRQRLISNLRVFCPSINCLHSMCETHGQKHTSVYIPSRKPQLTGQDMILSEGVPCGEDCFRHIQDFDRFVESLPPMEDHSTSPTDTLKTVLSMAPDLLPCQLAIVCLQPCNQLFAQRLQIFPDHEIISDEEARERTRRRLNFVDTKSIHTYELLAACAHPGLCTSDNCPCYLRKQHCSLICRCGVKCERQWAGCNCKAGKCGPRKCPCAKQLRECIPGICVSCDARGKKSGSNDSSKQNTLHLGCGDSGKSCNNTKMQCSASKPVEIKCGAYGLGAFACQDMGPNTFLGNYIGYILTERLANQSQELLKHTTRNYMFEVHSDKNNIELPLFDAAHLGNATRYLNHKEEDRANVEAKTMVVIGEHQIGFFTNKKVRAGEELFLYYGQNFWNH